MIVVAGDENDVGAAVGEREESSVDDLLGLGRRRRDVEEIAGDDHQVRALARRDAGDLVEHRAMLVGAAASLDQPAYVPVGGVEDPQG
jgi:hypothetical protein